MKTCFFNKISLPLPASSQNSTKMKNHSSLVHMLFQKRKIYYKTMNCKKQCGGFETF